eukprot:CAMPEP_0113461968 /NCGR_PEP_ID=MMETSP0014_2-20120614/11830_1 /TAXON_ID=2857 /ORGANISM="Nitzschia sp." /LENGTH=347 /DNA_ID=CAMNT_0000353777 /DNA_START=109 /DNA_END=1152 /DNA_ORIENTATION=+ /assembly_acc=CAM_ASM_000159
MAPLPNNNDQPRFRDNHYCPDSPSVLTTATFNNNNNNGNNNNNDDDEDNQGGPMIIRVIAPATLQEGYTFDVLVDDEPYTVSVPPGGVNEGEEFDVLYEPEPTMTNEKNQKQQQRLSGMPEEYGEDDATTQKDEDEEQGTYGPKKTFSGDSATDQGEGCDAETTTGNTTVWYDEKGTPIGRWRNPLYSCCDVVTQSTFWMGLFCTPILMAQLVTRLKLTWNGRAGASEDETSLSYNRIVLTYLFIALTLWKIPVVGGLSLLAFYMVVIVYIGAQVRVHMRTKYSINTKWCCPQKPWGQRLNDFITMFVCGCCGTIQMARHTHDDKEYPGHGCTTTGLGFDAPELMDV